MILTSQYELMTALVVIPMMPKLGKCPEKDPGIFPPIGVHSLTLIFTILQPKLHLHVVPFLTIR